MSVTNSPTATAPGASSSSGSQSTSSSTSATPSTSNRTTNGSPLLQFLPPPAASGSSNVVPSTSHHSPYDLRKKSPSSHDAWSVGGPSTSQQSQQYQCNNLATYQYGGGCNVVNGNSNNSSNDYTLPARKRPRRNYTATTETITSSAAHYLQFEMPDEVLLTIFSYLLEQDLCRLALVCKRFNAIANDTELWKRLYQSVYEYDLPLFNPEPCKYIFVKPENSEYVNPWKESFRQLYRGYHVRPGYQDKKYKGRNIKYFNNIQSALTYADDRNSANTVTIKNEIASHGNGSNREGGSLMGGSSNNGPMIVNGGGGSASSQMATDDNVPSEQQSSLIFLHAGHYLNEFLIIDSDVALIGAAPGNVAESIILERETESTMMFIEGAKNTYVGYMTLKFTPDVTSTVPHHKHYCLEIGENTSPTIDHCIIRSSSVGKCLSTTLLNIP